MWMDELRSIDARYQILDTKRERESKHGGAFSQSGNSGRFKGLSGEAWARFSGSSGRGVRVTEYTGVRHVHTVPILTRGAMWLGAGWLLMSRKVTSTEDAGKGRKICVCFGCRCTGLYKSKLR